MYYNQCTFVKNLGFGKKLTYVAYIPTTYAKLYNIVKLKRNDVWEDGWEIWQVGPKVDEKALPDAHAEVKAHRRRTGDSLPKKA